MDVCNDMSKRYHDEEWLREKYWGEKMTLEEMSNVCGVRYQTILRWMKKHEIERRSTGCQQAKGEYKDREWLEEQYVGQERSVSDIGKQFGVNDTTILYWLDKFDIETREASEAISLSWEGDDERRERAAQNVMENAQPEAPQIKNGEHRPETLERMSAVKEGEKNPMWEGGYEGEYGGSWRNKREDALERDGYECRVCSSNEELHVHHKVPVNQFDDPNDAHFMVNLLTVCRECHPRLDKISRRSTFVREVYL